MSNNKLVLVAVLLLVISSFSILVMMLIRRGNDSESNQLNDQEMFDKLPPPISAPGDSLPVGIANPASVNCKEKGGELKIVDFSRGQHGICKFGENMECEEWALMNGKCPLGGVDTSSLATDAQRLCVWIGGNLSEDKSQCTSFDGKVCPTDDLFEGKCIP